MKRQTAANHRWSPIGPARRPRSSARVARSPCCPGVSSADRTVMTNFRTCTICRKKSTRPIHPLIIATRNVTGHHHAGQLSHLGSAPWQPGPNLPDRRKRHQSIRACSNTAGDARTSDMNSGDFARIARDLCVSPDERDAVIRQGPTRATEWPRLLKTLGIDKANAVAHAGRPQRDMVRVCASVPVRSPVQPRSRAPSPDTMRNYCPKRGGD